MSSPSLIAHRSSLILGIDPGLQRTGWGVIRTEGNQLTFIDAGVVTSPAKEPLDVRLRALNEQLREVIAKHQPHCAAIEETFVNVNGASTLKLGQARGAIILTLALAELPVAEYAATLIKKSIVGNGHADKTQVAHMIQVLLPGCRALKADATDALAVAVCHAHHRKL